MLAGCWLRSQENSAIIISRVRLAAFGGPVADVEVASQPAGSILGFRSGDGRLSAKSALSRCRRRTPNEENPCRSSHGVPVTTHGDTDTRDDSREGGSFPIVGIGASAGGLEAFSALLKHLPLDTGMGFVLVQHLDPEHDSALPQLLGRATSLPVHEVTDNLRVEPNHVYVIPPNTNLSITAGVLTLRPRPKTRTPHRSIDFFSKRSHTIGASSPSE